MVNCSSRVVPSHLFLPKHNITEYPSIFNNASFSYLGSRFLLISDSESLITSSSSRQLYVPTRRLLFLSINTNAPRFLATRRSYFSSLFLISNSLSHNDCHDLSIQYSRMFLDLSKCVNPCAYISIGYRAISSSISVSRFPCSSFLFWMI